MPRIGSTNPYARELRRNATECETRVWLAVRDRRLGGYKFRRQATVGPYIVDLLCTDRRLIVEIDGGQHGGPDDQRRDAALVANGYRILRFWNPDVISNLDGVLQSIATALQCPSPNPLPHAGEGYQDHTP